MSIWRLEPCTPADDPRWLDHAIWDRVLVAAETSGEARLVASRLEYDPERPPVGNENPSFQSAFEDTKLYRVRQEQGAAGEGEPRIIEAVRRPDVPVERA